MTVILSAKASRQLEDLLTYLEEEWSPQSRRKFQARLHRFLEIIKSRPKAFPVSEKFGGARKCVVSPQTSLYYRVRGEVVEIISVQANRQNF
jgi:plasmid stabilization system protein ParE